MPENDEADSGSGAGTGPAAPLPGAATPPDTGYTEAGVPTLEGVRDKIEARYGTALGATELAEATPEARTAADRYEARQRAAAERLEQIRATLHGERGDD